MPDISIIVPIYNAEKYLNKCIDSLVNQTKKEIELILINDGSTDNSENVIKSYKDKRIKYFKNKNQGIGKTRNFGIDKATGKYIIFVDSDDYLDLNACEELYKKIEKEKADLVVCDFYRDIDGNLEEVIIPSFDTSSLKENKNLLLDINLAPWNKIYKTKLIKDNNIKFIENLKYEDAPFVVDVIKFSKKIAKLNEKLNYYVIHNNSETTVRDEKVFDIIKIIDLIRNKFTGSDFKEVLDILTVSILMNYNIQQRVQKDWNVGKRFINASFTYLNQNIPNYKKNSYFKSRSVIKSFIEKNKIVTKLYCKLYHSVILSKKSERD